MVHISDGVLSFPVLAAGWAITFIVLGAILWRGRGRGAGEEIPKLSVFTAAFFVASLIHLPIGPTSVHLVLNGLVGVMLGQLAYPAVFTGLVLQAVLFQHGGLTTIGINSVNIGVPALAAFSIFSIGRKQGLSEGVLGAVAGGLAVALSVSFVVLSLLTCGEKFMEVASLLTATHIPVIAVEAAVTASFVAFIRRVRPELLLGGKE